MEFNVADLVEAAVDRVPDREILVCGANRLTYAQLDARANRLAHYFHSCGLRRGQHIGIYGLNSSYWIEAMLAAYKIRAVPINVNYRYVEDELFYLFDNADLVALVHDAQFAPRIANVRHQLPRLQHFIAIDDGSGEDGSALRAVDYEDAVAQGGRSPPREPCDRQAHQQDQRHLITLTFLSRFRHELADALQILVRQLRGPAAEQRGDGLFG